MLAVNLKDNELIFEAYMENKNPVEYPSLFDLEHKIRHNQQKIKDQYEITPEEKLENFCNSLSSKTGINPEKIDQLIFKSADYLQYHQNLDADIKKWIKFLLNPKDNKPQPGVMSEEQFQKECSKEHVEIIAKKFLIPNDYKWSATDCLHDNLVFGNRKPYLADVMDMLADAFHRENPEQTRQSSYHHIEKYMDELYPEWQNIF